MNPGLLQRNRRREGRRRLARRGLAVLVRGRRDGRAHRSAAQPPPRRGERTRSAPELSCRRNFRTLPLALRGSWRRSRVARESSASPGRRRGSRTRCRAVRASRRHEHDHRGTTLAQEIVGQTDDGDVRDRRVLVEDVLDLLGGDVLAFANDDVLEPAGDREEPVVVEPAEVTGAKPSLVVERVGVACLVEIATTDLWPLGPYLTTLAGWAQTSVAVDHPQHRAAIGRPTVCDRCSSVSVNELTVRNGASVRP